MVAARVLKRKEDVVEREVAGEAFLVPIHGHIDDLQELFVLNEAGLWLWSRLDGRHSLEELAAGVAAEFEVAEEQSRRDLESFLRQLTDAGLVEERGLPVA